MTVISYGGVFDDMVSDYGWWNVRIDEDYINRQLIHNFIYDKKILVNDGYLITHPVLKDQIIQYDVSLAGALFRTGNLVMYHRGSLDEEIAAGLETAARTSKITKHLEVIKTEEWEKLAHAINALAAHHGVKKRKWPIKNTGQAFYKFMEKVLDHSPEKIGLRHSTKNDFEQVMNEYLVRNSNDGAHSGARGVWEDSVCSKLTGLYGDAGAKNKICELMQIANECYHMGHGACIQLEESQSNGSQVAVLTGTSGMFDEITGDIRYASCKHVFNAATLLITMPDKFRLSDSKKLLGLSEMEEFKRLRSRYLHKLDEFISADAFDEDLFNEAGQASDDYRKILVKELGHEAILGRNYADRAIIEATKVALWQPLQYALLFLTIGKVNLDDIVYRRIAENELNYEGRALGSRREVIRCIRELGLMQPYLTELGVNKSLSGVQDMP